MSILSNTLTIFQDQINDVLCEICFLDNILFFFPQQMGSCAICPSYISPFKQPIHKGGKMYVPPVHHLVLGLCLGRGLSPKRSLEDKSSRRMAAAPFPEGPATLPMFRQFLLVLHSWL